MAARASSEALAPFRVGSKELYLPNFRIALHRTPRLSADYARFTVPLWFSKLDLRDYLFHAYNVRIVSVRSYVKQSRVIQGDPSSPRPQPKRWHRPRSKKFMTVELEQPFVWPEEPKDLSPWNRDEVVAGDKEQSQRGEMQGATGDAVENKPRRKAMREQAEALLSGRVKWTPGRSKDLGVRIGR